MRPVYVCLLLLLSCMQAAAEPPAPAAGPIVPILTLTIQPPILKIRSEVNSTAVAQFNGTVAVDKMAGVRCVVTLSSSAEPGWVTEISPSTMVFTNEAPQTYTVAVSLPPGTPTSQGNLTVSGRAVANGLQSTSEARAVIDVTGPAIQNLTGANRTQGGGARPAAAFGGGFSGALTVSVIVVVLTAVTVAAYALHRRRRQREFIVEA